MNNFLTVIVIYFLSISGVYASSIALFDLKELPSSAQHIVLGKVVNVQPIDVRDNITIKIASSLKGGVDKTEVSFMLTSRGGLKDFDPQLEIGDTGVFFLNEVNGKFEKAYWGSVAIFEESNFKFED